MDSNTRTGREELLIRCWKTPGGMWLFYCHLLDFSGSTRLNAASPGPMGMRLIESRLDLENVVREILVSLKIGSPAPSTKLYIVDSPEEGQGGRFPDSGFKHHGTLLQKDSIEEEEDRPYCDHISRLERFFKTLPVGYSATPLCAGCEIEKKVGCLKEYRFSAANDAVRDRSCVVSRGIDPGGIRCGLQID